MGGSAEVNGEETADKGRKGEHFNLNMPDIVRKRCSPKSIVLIRNPENRKAEREHEPKNGAKNRKKCFIFDWKKRHQEKRTPAKGEGLKDCGLSGMGNFSCGTPRLDKKKGKKEYADTNGKKQL